MNKAEAEIHKIASGTTERVRYSAEVYCAGEGFRTRIYAYKGNVVKAAGSAARRLGWEIEGWWGA